MRLSTSFSVVGAPGAGSDVLGPLPPGTILRGIRASSSGVEAGMGAGAPLLTATLMGGPAIFSDTTLIRAGQPLFSARGATNASPTSGLPIERVPYGCETYLALEEVITDGGFVGIEFEMLDSTVDGSVSLDVLFPEEDDRRGLPESLRLDPSKGPLTSRKSKAPHPLVRDQVPIPVQSQPREVPGHAPVPFRK